MTASRGRTALVTGAAERVRAVSAALSGVGFEVVSVERLDRLGERCAGLGLESLACYIQLPLDVRAGGGTPVERVHHFLTGGLLARFAAAATVLPNLQPGATVVLVAGHQPAEDTPDDPHARFDLLRVLARAVLAQNAEWGVRAVVVGAHRSPDDIAEVASRDGRVQWPRSTDYAAVGGQGSYDDWRREALSLSGPQDWELTVTPAEPPARYLGWVTADSRRAVVAVRGSVLSPLPLAVPEGPPGPSPSWGHSGPSAHPLARALLRDALRPHPLTEGCPGEPAPCPACAQVDQAAETLVEAFADEVLRFLPAAEFALSAPTIRTWAHPRAPGTPQSGSPPVAAGDERRGVPEPGVGDVPHHQRGTPLGSPAPGEADFARGVCAVTAPTRRERLLLRRVDVHPDQRDEGVTFRRLLEEADPDDYDW